jgi:tetratricopeptide (TPR) repeat protein
LQDRIATWDQRVERQHERIVEGLQNHRQQMTIEQVRRRETERLRVVGQPPLDVTSYFKDRQRDQERILQLLAEPTTRLVSVIGHGGMGKTALACKVLQDLEHYSWPHTETDEPLDGIVYLSTRTGGISLERLFLDCVKLLEEEEQERLIAIWTNPQVGTREKVEHLLKALRRGRYVILLDNLEDLLDDRGHLTDDELRLFFKQLLTTGQGAQLVVTSRIALTLQREVLRFDRQVKLLEGLPTADGVLLLRELDPNGDYGLRDAPAEQLVAAVELTHGVPRALEILAGVLAHDPFVTLEEVLETFYEQEDVVQALIEENYRRLDQEARHVMDALAVFRRPVPVLAVDYLLEPFVPGLAVPSIVRRLIQANIVSVDRDAKTITLHSIDQDYAYSRLPEEGERESEYARQALEGRAGDYYAQLRTPEETWADLEDLEPQLHEFEHRVRARDYDRAYQVLESIDSKYLYRWGYYTRLAEMCDVLVGYLSNPHSRAANLNRLGSLHRALGKVSYAVELHKNALTVAWEIEDKENIAFYLGDLGSAYRDLGSFVTAIQLYKEGLAIAYETKNHLAESILLGRLGFSSYLAGEIENSIEFYEDGLTVAWDIGNRWGQEGCLSGLGDAHEALGKIEHATKLYEYALGIARDRGSPRGQSIRLGRLGGTYKTLGNVTKAQEAYSKALSIARKIGDRKREALHLEGLSDVYRSTGQVAKSLASVEEALAIVCDIGNQRRQSGFLVRMAKILLVGGQLQKAYRCCVEASRLGESPDVDYTVPLAMGIILLHEHSSAAAKSFAEAVMLCRALLTKTPSLYKPCYALSTALVGQAVCSSNWVEARERSEVLSPILVEYHRALKITAAPGIVEEAIQDLELIQAAGIEGLEPVFELLESAEYVPDSTEDLDAFLAEIPLPEE